MLSPIEELGSIARSLNCEIDSRHPRPTGRVLARIDGQSFEAIAGSVFIEGESSLFGKVERVGGATDLRCGPRIPQQPRMLICSVASDEVARALGQRLYENVLVHGTATWYRRDWRLRRFSIHSVHQLKTGSIRQAVAALRAAGGSAWDRIADPEEYLAEVRGE